MIAGILLGALVGLGIACWRNANEGGQLLSVAVCGFIGGGIGLMLS